MRPVLCLFLLAPAFAIAQPLQEIPLDFVHTRGESGQRWFPETMGAGVAIADLDGDGRLDLVFADGKPWDAPGRGTAIYRNRGGLEFARDETQDLLVQSYGMGVAAGDVDADGVVDLVLSALDGIWLARGTGAGSFAPAVQLGGGWSTALSLLSLDTSDHLAIFAGRYVDWSPETDIWCSLDASTKSYCTPELYEPTSPSLFVAAPGGWRDAASDKLPPLRGKVLGAVASDVDGDGWTDLLVANDTMPDFYLRWSAGRFEELGLYSGMALSTQGMARAGMGIDIADFAGDGRPGLAVGHFSGEALGLYRLLRPGVFRDEATTRGLAAATLPELTFGLALVDLDLDGACDLVTANGHIESDIARLRPSHRYRQPLGLYWNRDGQFVAESVAGEFVARGLAAGDLDDDGDPDLVMTQNGGFAVLWRNERNPRRWLRVDLSSAWAAGATVELRTDRRVLSGRVHLGSSYLSCNAPQLCFGLLEEEQPRGLIVRTGAGRILRRDIDPAMEPTWRIRVP